MAKVQWFKNTVNIAVSPGPIQFWFGTLFKPFGPASFIPITKIKDICVTCKLMIGRELVLAVNPIRKKIFL